MSSTQEILLRTSDVLTTLADDLQLPQVDLDHALFVLEGIGNVFITLAASGDLPAEDRVFHLLGLLIMELEQISNVTFMSKEQLLFLLENHFKVAEIAHIYGVSKRTVHRRMKDHGLSVRQTYSDISSYDLEKVIAAFLSNFPNSGIRTVTGHLISQNIRVQQHRVRQAIKAVDPLGNHLRGLQLNVIPRVPYHVPGPLSLWHIDGNHKLIRWRIVIHGGVDGFSRRVVYLVANNNNKASTVLECFLRAIHQHGLPHRVRSDKGGENVEVARFMLEHPERGPERQSHITGRSVHNQRIERMWRDVWTIVISNYYITFRNLESSGHLDPDNELHIICLHFVFLPRLNWHLQEFVRMWDQHPLSTERNRSPLQLWTAGLLVGHEQINEQIDENNWGIDWDGPFPAPEPATLVDVPVSPQDLQESVVLHLRENIDPFMTSDAFGVDIYQRALSLLQNFLSTHR